MARWAPPEERLAAGTQVDPDSGCWVWTGTTNSHGYGQIRVGAGKRLKTHRYSYELRVGPIPDGFDLDHLCRNTLCLNPGHLEPVTHRINLLRGVGTLAARGAAATHCPQGHKYTPENLIVSGLPARKCRPCNNARVRALRASRSTTLIGA